MNIQNPEEVVVSPELEEETALLSYWTEERMDAAEPLPFPIPAGPPIDDGHVSTPQLEEAVSGESRGPDEGESHEHPES